MRAIGTWFWGLDRSVPWVAWSSLLLVGLLLRGAHWLTGHSVHLPVWLGAGFEVLSVALILAWFVLYERDAVRARRARQRERAAGS